MSRYSREKKEHALSLMSPPQNLPVAEVSRRTGVTAPGLREGDVLTYRDLLHGLMLSSGNDAAQAIARTVGQTLLEHEQHGDPVGRFVRAMNELAVELRLTRTRFANPNGLDVKGLYSTAKDIALLGAEAFSHPVTQSVAQKKTYSTLISGANPRKIELESTVSILGEHGVLWGKTGTTPAAGSCLVLYSFLDDRPFVTVLLASAGEGGRYDDARKILVELIRHTASARSSLDDTSMREANEANLID